MNAKMIRRILHRVGAFFARPLVKLFVGSMLLLTGIFEISETIIEELIGFEIKMAHGMIVFALSQMFVSTTHILEGIEDFAALAEIEELQDNVR